MATTSLLPTYNPALPDYKVYTDCLTQSFNPLFAAQIAAPADGLVFMTGSSTIQDLQGDTMESSALQNMTEVHPRLSIWMNHDYDLPSKLYGSLVCAPIMSTQNGIADLHLAVETELENPDAAQTFRYIQKGRRLGCSGGFKVLDYTLDTEGIDEDDFFAQLFAPMRITHVEAVEWSVVGVPANQRSWVENAAQGIFLRALAEGKDEEARKLAPLVKSLFPRDYQSTLKGLASESLRRDMEKMPERPSRPSRLLYEPMRKTFVLQHQKAAYDVKPEQVQRLLALRGQEIPPTLLADLGIETKPANEEPDDETLKAIKPPNPPEGTHESFSGTHTHAHVAYGQGTDGAMHTHTHTHHDEADHHHDHTHTQMENQKDAEPEMQKADAPDASHPTDDGSFHDPTSGTHTHPHKAYGKDSTDGTIHSHSHTHLQDNNHTHQHPPVPPTEAERGAPHDPHATPEKALDPMHISFRAMGEALGYDMAQLSGATLTRNLTKADMVHCQSIHDHVHALSGGAVCENSAGSNSGQSTESAAAQANQQRDAQNSWQKSLDSLTTLVKGFEGVDLKALSLEAITAGAAARTALETAALFQEKMEALQKSLGETQQVTEALRNMPLPRPTGQERQIADMIGTASYEQMRSAGGGAPAHPATLTLAEALARTSIVDVAQTRNGIGMVLKYREWPEGLAPAQGRPALSPDEQSLMTPLDILLYGENRRASVPLLESDASL